MLLIITIKEKRILKKFLFALALSIDVFFPVLHQCFKKRNEYHLLDQHHGRLEVIFHTARHFKVG